VYATILIFIVYFVPVIMQRKELAYSENVK